MHTINQTVSRPRPSMTPAIDAGTRIIGGVSGEFWIKGFGEQPANPTKLPINKMTHSNRFCRIDNIERLAARASLFDLLRVIIVTPR